MQKFSADFLCVWRGTVAFTEAAGTRKECIDFCAESKGLGKRGNLPHTHGGLRGNAEAVVFQSRTFSFLSSEPFRLFLRFRLSTRVLPVI